MARLASPTHTFDDNVLEQVELASKIHRLKEVSLTQLRVIEHTLIGFFRKDIVQEISKHAVSYTHPAAHNLVDFKLYNFLFLT